MATNEQLAPPVRPSIQRAVLLGACAIVGGAAFAYLLADGLWLAALAPLVAVPGFVLLHRYPLVVVTVWLLVLPLVDVTSSVALRSVFWLVHRAMPVTALAVVVVSAMLRISDRKLPRLGLPEMLMGGYLVATLVSIAYTSDAVTADVILLYDRAFIPMVLYLLVRLLEPDERDLKLLLPAVAFVLLTQSFIAVVSWIAPGVLPFEWLGKVGERTTGSLRNADVFGVTVLFCGMILLHAGLTSSHRVASRVTSVPLFILALVMAFMTFSRASWFAGIVAMLGLLSVYPRFVRRFAVVVVPLIVVALASGLFGGQVRFAQERFLSEQSEESALSRLPVAYAGIRMFGARPFSGWGYENFDQYDLRFQSRIGNLVYPEKDHASHNLYITILAEQGLVGFLLFLGPLFIWLSRTRAGLRRMPAEGFISRKLVLVLWLSIAANFVINNFVRVQVTFGIGMWWLTLGLIASLLARHLRTPDRGDLQGGTAPTITAGSQQR